jgi:UDP-N-acetylglucosamine acyltransferase
MTQIHATAVVDSKAEIAATAAIGPLCYVGPDVKIGAGTRLVSHVSVTGPTTIGQNNTIWPQAVIGADPQDLKFHGERVELTIGDNNDIRELVTIHRGTENGGGFTRIGSDNLIMVGCHIAHDCVIGSHVVMANNVGLAGHIHIKDHAAIGGYAGFHHFVTVNEYAYVGGMSRIVHDVPPFMVVEGSPGRVRGLNIKGLIRHRFEEEAIRKLKDAHRRLYRGNGDEGAGDMAAGLAELETRYADDELVAMLTGAIRRAMIGIHGRYLENHRQDDPWRNRPR